ncbi:hypothetical protein Afe04nite_79350 [Asanoa ferruginea]|nr:hypothetical protein Afe04nite_79350 [Asanoa ferruginea]
MSLALVLLGGCGSSDDAGGVASAGGAAPRPNVSPSVSRLDQMIIYTRCMREHGVPMADPEVEGETVRQGRYDKEAVSSAVERAAEDACAQQRPPQETGPGIDFKNGLARQFAKCMRDHGVADYPDPDPNGQTRVGPEIGQDPQYRDARKACDAEMDAATRSFLASTPVPR